MASVQSAAALTRKAAAASHADLRMQIRNELPLRSSGNLHSLLEQKLQSRLHNARRACSADHPERVVSEGAVGIPKLRVIERVERFKPESAWD
jgi:hypothetical protein